MSRVPHLKTATAIDEPSATATDDAGKMVILGDDGHIANGFLDPDIEALGNNSTNGLLARTGAGTVAARTLTGPAAGITVSNGDGVSGNPTLALANDLAAYEGLSTTGLVVRTGDGTATTRTLTAPAAGITVTDGSGVSGNPTLVLANDLSALEGLASTGFAVRTGSDAWAQREIQGTAGSVTVTNGTGVSGNPVISLDATLAALAAANWAANAIPIGSGADTLSQVSFAANTFPARASTGDLVAKTITDFGLSLVDDADASAARTTLGVTATGADTTYAFRANNLSDLASASTARTNLGLGTAATQNTGTSGANLPFLNGTNTWGGTNLFQLDTDANYVLEVKNVDTGTTSAAVLRSTSDSAVVSLITHAAARTVSRCGQTLGDWAELLVGATSSGLLIDTNGAAPMKFGTNNTLAMTIDTSQLVSMAAGLAVTGAISATGAVTSSSVTASGASLTDTAGGNSKAELRVQNTTSGAIYNYRVNASNDLVIEYFNGATWTERMRYNATTLDLTVAGGILSTSATDGVGYATGAGGTVTQATNKSTGVTINKVCGQITMNGAALAASTTVTFLVTNSAVAATDTIVVTMASGAGALIEEYQVWAGQVAAGSFRVALRNVSSGSLSQAVILNFTVIKGVTS